MGDPCGMIFQIPRRCEGCTKNEEQVSQCRTRVYQFQVFGSACPRELAFPAEDAEEEPEEISDLPEPEDETAYLKPTYEKLGALLPVLQTRSGEIIDGVHRRQVDPGWPGHVLYDFDDPVKVAMARLVINVCRRRVSPEEKTQLLTQIAKLTGWTPQQIADGMGLSYGWVMKYLPSEYKDKAKAEAGAVGGQALAKKYRKSQDFALRRRAEEPEESSEQREVDETKPQPLLTGFKGECPECHATLLIEHREFPDGKIDHKIIGEKPA